MNPSLREVLAQIPNEVFFDQKGNPAYNAIFYELARLAYGESSHAFSIPAGDFLTNKLPNLSTFQRTVARERQRRLGLARR